MADIILSLSDRYFLDNYVGLTEVGLYSIGYRIAGMLSIIIMKPFSFAWSPYMFSIASRPDAKQIYAKVLVYYTFLSAFAGLGLSIFAEEALKVIATPEYFSANKIVPGIVVSYILCGMMSILVASIHIKKKSKYVAVIFIGAAIVNLTSNYTLIPILGMWGAALATLISYAFLNISFLWFSQRLYPIDHEFDRIFKIALISIAIYFLTLISVFPNSLTLTIIYKLILFLSFPFLLYSIKFYRKEELTKGWEFFNKLLVRFKIKKNIEI